jgi:glyoxylase-like metal-dependent hydrolase (beta-lactamase superfamily II)
MTTLAAGLDYMDVRFLGYPKIIATAILQGPSGVALVDPGPQTTLATLTADLDRRGIAVHDVTGILATHIHLDHAGAAGCLVRENPSIKVYVHAVGAPHMVDPSRLLASASKLYGDDMERLWGEVLPVPAGNVHPLGGGERIVVAGREVRVAYTPGHATHHVSYLDEASGVAFVGDTLGIRRPPDPYVMPPAPPPDIDLEAWKASVQRILAWNPSLIFLTHFGPFEDTRTHADELLARLAEWTALVRALLREPGLTDAQRCERFVKHVRLDLQRRMSSQGADAYERSGRIDFSWMGMSRAISKTLAS